ncbi:MAG: hypothetical protein KIS92_06490 [Planctomycetota bacterium]|nr:hypothetical protein [Planctomycetota bacterium]
MATSPFHHPYRIDQATWSKISTPTALSSLQELPTDLRFLKINPIVFTHVYLLLGNNPQRFTTDLSLYLKSLEAYFDRTTSVGGIAIPQSANPDLRRRLSEDLGVGLSTYFMVESFGLTWESISQIPANIKLSKTRPDFQGFTKSNDRHIFEAKGTTQLQSIPKFLSKAESQVKAYPNNATSKIAFVSYLCADERFFPSTSFVVDPPSLPESVPPNQQTSVKLHAEKVINYIGLERLSKEYIGILSRELAEELRLSKGDESSYTAQRHLRRAREDFHRSLNGVVPKLQPITYKNLQFLGRTIYVNEMPYSLFLGVEKETLLSLSGLYRPARGISSISFSEDNSMFSIFTDGTILRITSLSKEDPVIDAINSPFEKLLE